MAKNSAAAEVQIPMSEDDERRIDERTATIMPVTWTDLQRPRGGTLKDFSRRGLFLAPNWAPSETIEPGQIIELRAATEDFTFDLEAIVRWAGLSPRHLCNGYGLEVLSEETLARLFALAQKTGK